MCGICGYVGIDEDGLLESMTAALLHRGPDSEGYFKANGVGLGHRRLSIIDVKGGSQPIANEDGTLILICNGEIYNFASLRNELIRGGHKFRTQSDSEVILHLYEDLGPQCLDRLNGMFALAIYDKTRRRLFLARDRLGIRPLYYTSLPGKFLFASESKSILRYKGFDLTVDPTSIVDYLALRYVPGPGGILKELNKFPAAHYGTVNEDGQLKLHQYWKPDLYDGPFTSSRDEYLEGLADHFERSIQRRLISDVPVGAYLSGGLDSSVIVAAISKLTSEPVRTFSVGFNYEHDELKFAADTARALGCVHSEIICRDEDIGLLPNVVYHLDEPVGDGIVIPMYQLAREAKKHVTVILTGEGADEMFGGYLFHRALLWGNRLARLVPSWVRRHVLRAAIEHTPTPLINLAFDYPASLGKRGRTKVADLVGMLEPDRLVHAYRHLISLFDERDIRDLFTKEFETQQVGVRSAAGESEIVMNSAPYLNRILHLQFAHWLPDDILMKQDKMSMAHGIEGRVPFLDHELVEYALKLPPSLKIRRGVSKHILRQYASRILPREVVSRKKMPFYVPLEKYCQQHSFQEMMHDTLSKKSVSNRGIIRPEAAEKLCQSIHKGEFIYTKQVLSLMVLELWFRIVVDRRGVL